MGFLNWATSKDGGQSMASSMDYAPLSPGVQKKVKAAINALTWQGKQIAAGQ